MEKIVIAGVEINKVSIKELLFNKTMILAYIFLAIGIYGVYEVMHLRYFFNGAVLAHDAGLHPGNHQLVEHVKDALYGEGGEVKREAPWSLYIVNYMYMIYTGSGIIFLVALDEILNLKIIKETAAGFMSLGLAMIIGGLFTIMIDLNSLHMPWMFLSPNFKAGMWQMVPLYSIYIPFVIFEIYLLLTKNEGWAKKISFMILILSVLIDIAEYYIQANLFSMNKARHLWTTYPVLTLYFIISSYVAAIGVMGVYSFFAFRKSLSKEYHTLIEVLRKMGLITITLLAVYEAIAYLSIDKEWAFLILFGPFKYAFFGGYIFLAMTIPYLLMLRESKNIFTVIASVFMIIGTYVGRYIFVYAGNAFPMSDRFGTGFEMYDQYAKIKGYYYYPPEMSEVLVVIGSFGVILAVYVIIEKLFSVSKIREH